MMKFLAALSLVSAAAIQTFLMPASAGNLPEAAAARVAGPQPGHSSAPSPAS